jgi:LPXTG-motif cell wall-anchored protein
MLTPEDAEAVDHRGVGVGADERVGIRELRCGPVRARHRHHDAGKELEVHLVHDAGVRRHRLEVAEALLTPLEEAIALLVALELELAVLLERVLAAEDVDLHRVVDDELHRLERVDLLRIAAHLLHRIAHRREIDDGGDAGEVLKEHTARGERDLLRRLGGRLPGGHRLDMRGQHGHAIFGTEQVLEQDLERERELRRLGELGNDGIEAVDGEGVVADLENGAAAEGVLGHFGPDYRVARRRRAMGPSVNAAWTLTLTSTMSAAALPISNLSVGTHPITATYGGDTNFAGSASAPLTQTVGAATTTTTVSSSANPGTVGAAITFTATVTPGAGAAGTPSGTVTFNDGATALATGNLAAGIATFSTSSLGAGAHAITAVYAGDTTFSGSTSTALDQQVGTSGVTVALTATPSPATLGQAIKFTAAVTSGDANMATGKVTFSEGTTSLGEGTLSSGVATFTTTSLTGGNHTLTATYGGDSTHTAGATGSTTVTVNALATKTVLAATPNPGTEQQTVTLTATGSSSESNYAFLGLSLAAVGIVGARRRRRQR